MVGDYMKALNRKEALVNAKANGTLDSFKPLTRDEAFTKKALELGGGASSWNDLTDKPFYEEVFTYNLKVAEGESASEGYANIKSLDDINANHAYTFVIRGDVYPNIKAVIGQSYYDYYMWGTTRGGDFIKYPFGMWAQQKYAGETMWNEDGTFNTDNGNYIEPPMSFRWDSTRYPDLDIENEVKIYRTERKLIDTKYLPEHLQFGEEVETVSVECDYYNNGSTNTLDIDMPLVSGNVYQIEISKDGEVLDAVSCTAYETTIMNTSAIVLGNAELANGTGGNGESVMIAYAPSQNAYMGAIDGEVGDYHIKVTGPVARIKTLDPKYLPEGVGGGLLITLDDNTGEWTANMSYDEALKAIFNGAPVVYSEKYDFETIFVYNPTVTVHNDYIEISVDAGDVEGVALKFAPDNTIGELGPM